MAKGRVLIAEDETSIRDMCARALTIAGYEATGVPGGREAIDYALSHPIDALLTDLRMPGVDGLQACRAIREVHPNLAAIVMTGYGTMESAIDALEIGVSEFVLKPFRPRDLVDAVGRALAKSREHEDSARLRALIPLLDITQVFMSSVDLGQVPTHVVRVARDEMDATSASLMLLDDAGGLKLHASVGLPDEAIARAAEQPSVVGQYVLEHREPVIIQGDASKDERFAHLLAERQSRPSSGVSLPLVHKDQVLGVLNVSRGADAPPFGNGDVELLAVLASQAAVAIENARLFQETQDAYRRLAELDHLKSEFISIASHELRAPLAILMAYATLLEDEATGEMREHLGLVLESAMQLKSLIDEMVSLRRIDTRETQVDLTFVEVGPVVEGLVEEIAPLADSRSLRIEVNLPDDLPSPRADMQVLSLILSNLLSNAVKFTPDGGWIRITGQANDQAVEISVSDSGIGIAEEHQDRIFERFYQVEGSLRREHGGIGLGLSIAREMAELLDGQIALESELEHGSTFTLSLPRAN